MEHLGLTKVGIKTDRHGIIVDDHLQTNIPNIYASGDVISKTLPKLTPTATFESNYIAGQLLGSTAAIDYPVIPSVVFTLPRIAQVGIPVEAAKFDT
nr:FAD-dependent oxidoreductase [Lactiplantibacillus plantarum]